MVLNGVKEAGGFYITAKEGIRIIAKSLRISLLTVLFVCGTLSAFAQEASWRGQDAGGSVSSDEGENPYKIFSNCLAKRLLAAPKKERLLCYSSYYAYSSNNGSSEDGDTTLGRAALGAFLDTFGKTPLGERLAGKMRRYSRVEYTKYRSEKRGRLYALGKEAPKDGERDYYWLLRCVVYENSPFSIELQGSFQGSKLTARFANDDFVIGFGNKKMDDFVSSIAHRKDATVHFNVYYDLEGLCFARVSILF